MLTEGKSTLTQFLIEERRRHPHSTGELNALITDISVACKSIARKVAFGHLSSDSLAPPGTGNQEPNGKALDQFCHKTFLHATEWGGHVAGLLSAESEQPHLLPAHYPRGKYLLLFDPLEGAADLDVNVALGSIFSVLHAVTPGANPEPGDFLQQGAEQVCAGYAIYGPSTMLVMTLGNGTHAFTLEPLLGEWILSHAHLAIPTRTREFAINASNARFWEPAVKRYVDECLAGSTGPRGSDFSMRWIASLVAETHRILMRGGVFMSTQDTRESVEAGRLRLLYQVNPISFLIEQAEGRASTGRSRLLTIRPDTLHQSTSLVFGSKDEVTRIDQYHEEDYTESFDSPLFAARGLFAQPSA